jgi:hypothetical protein
MGVLWRLLVGLSTEVEDGLQEMVNRALWYVSMKKYALILGTQSERLSKCHSVRKAPQILVTFLSICSNQYSLSVL